MLERLSHKMNIEFPEYDYKVKRFDKEERIFDPFRKKWVLITPEEWVRQHFLQFLVQTCKYPESLIAVEKEIKLGELKKRFDILVYDRTLSPWLLVECKSSDIKLTENVLQQALRYNISVPVRYIVITNGKMSLAWEKTGGELVPIMHLPEFL